MATRANGRSRDMWAVPPGGLPTETKRSLVKPAIAFAVVVALSVGGSLTYASMKKSTAVPAADALAEFQSSGPAEARPEAGSDEQQRRSADRRSMKAQPLSRKGTENGKNAIATAAASSPDRSSSQEPSRTAPAGAPAHQEPRSDRTQAAPPEDGVYAWSIDGYEQAPGIRRDLPSRSHRVITHQGDNGWTEHHIFSEQREQWMEMTISPEGVAARSVRNRVEMGPVEVDNTITFNPVMFVARYPSQVGQTWRGSWSGKTSGSYTARTFERSTVVVEGEEIEVYASEVVMDMRGEVQGTAITRSWYSLEHRIVVKQYQKMDVKSGPGDYRSEWTGQVLSLTPQR